jgi:hypothetical protein
MMSVLGVCPHCVAELARALLLAIPGVGLLYAYCRIKFRKEK